MVLSHNASLHIEIPGGPNFKQNLHKVVYVSTMHLVFKKLSTESRGFPIVVFKKLQSQIEMRVHKCFCRYDAIEVSFQEKLDSLL